MDEGTFVEWLKSEGDYVASGDMLFVLEGEKALQEVESFDAGYLCIPADAPRRGATVKVGDVIGFLLAEGEPARDSVRVHSSPPTSPRPTASAGEPSEQDGQRDTVVRSESQSVRTKPRQPAATPRARRTAQELGVDWTGLAGSGRDGRIRERDVLAAHGSKDTGGAQEPRPSAPGQFAPASRLRQVTAQRMMAGVHQAAPVTLTTKVNAAELVAFRDQFRAEATDGAVPSYNDILIHWVAQTLRELPELNACWYRGGIHTYDGIHIATAVDTPDGLLAPIVRHADRLTPQEIAEKTRRLVAQARSGQVDQNQLSGGTFTISNLGMFGVDAFSPILNLPQAAILGIGRIVDEPVVRQGQLEAGRTLTFSLTFDHRVVDGAPAARWLQRLCERAQTATVTSP